MTNLVIWRSGDLVISTRTCPLRIADEQGRVAKSRWPVLAVLLTVLGVLAVGCAAGSAFRKGEDLMRAGDLDMAVASYRKAVQAAPENATYKIALQRAMLAASRAHMERAKEYEQMGQLEAAVGEYKLASENDPSNRLASAKAIDLERT